MKTFHSMQKQMELDPESVDVEFLRRMYVAGVREGQISQEAVDKVKRFQEKLLTRPHAAEFDLFPLEQALGDMALPFVVDASYHSQLHLPSVGSMSRIGHPAAIPRAIEIYREIPTVGYISSYISNFMPDPRIMEVLAEVMMNPRNRSDETNAACALARHPEGISFLIDVLENDPGGEDLPRSTIAWSIWGRITEDQIDEFRRFVQSVPIDHPHRDIYTRALAEAENRLGDPVISLSIYTDDEAIQERIAGSIPDSYWVENHFFLHPQWYARLVPLLIGEDLSFSGAVLDRGEVTIGQWDSWVSDVDETYE